VGENACAVKADAADDFTALIGQYVIAASLAAFVEGIQIVKTSVKICRAGDV
jgi:hypothetical protein